MKSLAERIPEPLGKSLSKVPYSWRLGAAYRQSKERIDQFGNVVGEEQKNWVENQLFQVVCWAKNNHPFYRNLYKDISISKGLEQFRRLPIVTKDDLQKVPLETRSIREKGRYLANTGGTSGNPLVFYLDREAFAREGPGLAIGRRT